MTSLGPASPSGLLSQVLVELAIFLSPCLTAEMGTSSLLVTVGSWNLAQVLAKLTLNICLLEEPMNCHYLQVQMLEELQVLVHREPHPP